MGIGGSEGSTIRNTIAAATEHRSGSTAPSWSPDAALSQAACMGCQMHALVEIGEKKAGQSDYASGWE